MDSIKGIRVFIRALLAFGIGAKEVRMMPHVNPCAQLTTHNSRIATDNFNLFVVGSCKC